MKKNMYIIYVLMLIVGSAGILIYSQRPKIPVIPETIKQPPPKEMISVAIARNNLDAGTVLQSSDFQIKNITTNKGSADTQFNITNSNLNNHVLKTSISANDWIPPSMLVSPDNDEYLSLLLKPGNIAYTFTLDDNDSYLLNNISSGEYVDVFFSYSINYESGEISSPSDSIRNSHLKPLMSNRRVLAIRPAQKVRHDGIEKQGKGSQIIVELRSNEVKMLKGLEEKQSRIILFPSDPNVKAANLYPEAILPAVEASWPVSEDIIFNESHENPGTIVTVNELRG